MSTVATATDDAVLTRIEDELRERRKVEEHNELRREAERLLAERQEAERQAQEAEEKAQRIAELREVQQKAQAEALDAVVVCADKVQAARDAMKALQDTGGDAPDYAVVIQGPGILSGTDDPTANPDFRRSDEGRKTPEQVQAIYEAKMRYQPTRAALQTLRRLLVGGEW